MYQKQYPLIFAEGGKFYRVLPDKVFNAVNIAFLAIFFCGFLAICVSIGGVLEQGFMSRGAISDTAWVFIAGWTLWALGLLGQHWIIMKMGCMIYFRIRKKGVPLNAVRTKKEAFRINIT